MRIRDLPKIEAILKNEGKPEYVVLRFENYKKFIQKARLMGKIDEPAYVKAHPDVATAVRNGKIKSATEHYLGTGYVEGRAARLVD